MKWMVFQPQFCTCKAKLGQGHPGLMRWILLWVMPLVQECSLILLISSPVRYHWITDAPTPCDRYIGVFLLFQQHQNLWYISSQTENSQTIPMMRTNRYTQFTTSVLLIHPTILRFLTVFLVWLFHVFTDFFSKVVPVLSSHLKLKFHMFLVQYYS